MLKINTAFYLLSFLLAGVSCQCQAFSFHYQSSGNLYNSMGNFSNYAESGTSCSSWSTAGTVTANGQSGGTNYDGVYVHSVTSVPASFSTDGITVNISPGVGSSIWTGAQDYVPNKSRNVSVQICRPANKAFQTINGGTIRVKVIQTNASKSFWAGGTGNSYYIDFYLPTIAGVSKTCDVTGVDNSTVRLPSVQRATMKNGTGRYPDTSKDFTFVLKCKSKPKINLKFDSENKMTGVSDDVLANTTSGNANIGFQIYYGDTALKFGNNLALMTSSQDTEELKFTAYYYRKSTEINAGTVTGNAEFTFTYD